jgi:hypothetical protein
MLRILETPFHPPLEPVLRMNRERYYSSIWGLKCWSILQLLVSMTIVLNWQFQSDSRSLLFWNVTQRRLVVSYRRFGTIYWYNLQGSTSTKIGVISSFTVPVTGPTVRYSATRVNLKPDEDLIPSLACYSDALHINTGRVHIGIAIVSVCTYLPALWKVTRDTKDNIIFWRVRVTFIPPRLS